MYEIFRHPELVQQFTVTVVTSEITLLLPTAQLYLFLEKGRGGEEEDDLPKTFHIILYIPHLMKDMDARKANSPKIH
jgi:hypothetical protein